MLFWVCLSIMYYFFWAMFGCYQNIWIYLFGITNRPCCCSHILCCLTRHLPFIVLSLLFLTLICHVPFFFFLNRIKSCSFIWSVICCNVISANQQIVFLSRPSSFLFLNLQHLHDELQWKIRTSHVSWHSCDFMLFSAMIFCDFMLLSAMIFYLYTIQCKVLP